MFSPKLRKCRSRDLSPGILSHILAVIGIDCIRNMTQKIVIIAVCQSTVNCNAIAVLNNDIIHTLIGKDIFHVRNQIPQVALSGRGIRSVFPYNSHQLAHRGECAHPINQICQKLLGLCSLEHERFAINKCLKFSEALKTDFWVCAGLTGVRRCPSACLTASGVAGFKR